MQHHAIIAKTAAFVATKGPQMEIVIKAKQKTKDNNHFEFLEFDDALRPYYDHVLAMIKRGRYQFTGKCVLRGEVVILSRAFFCRTGRRKRRRR